MATDDKYDRQLRLWGADGQRRLGHCHVLLINATPTGTEAMKNLILPGIQACTIADPTLVTPADVGNNFFVTADKIGKQKCEVAAELLGELNPDVQMFNQKAGVAAFIANPKLLEPYHIIVGADLTEKEIHDFAEVCEKLHKPFVISNAFGLVGIMRSYKPEHLVIDSRPSDKQENDLRIHRPFKEILDYAHSFDMQKMEEVLFKHVPYVVILVKAIDLWLKSKPALPKTFPEKEEFVKVVKSMARKYAEEDNFQEAVKHCPDLYKSEELNENLKLILGDKKCVDPAEKSPFWVMAAGLKVFFDKFHELPLTGKIPDMTADTESYLRLQKVYEDKAAEHRKIFFGYVQEVMKARGMSEKDITEDQIKNFCGLASTLMCIRYHSVKEEMELGPNPETLMSETQDPESLIYWYILYRASLRYQTKFGFYPGEKASHDKYLAELPQFAAIVKEVQADLLAKKGITYEVPEVYCKEMLRFSNAKIHNICAILGGMVGQEVIKLVAEIFSPANNTVIFDGIQSKIGSFLL